MNEFFIKKTSTQPILTMKVNKDNSVSYQEFNEMIQNSAISFSMKNMNTDTYRVLNGEGGILLKDKLNIDNPDEFYIYYKFKDRDVRKPGKYLAEFKINFFNTPDKDFFIGQFIGPIHEPLYVIIEDSLLHSEDIYDTGNDIDPVITEEFTESATTVTAVLQYTTPVEYYKNKNTSEPLFIDETLETPLNGYVKYLLTATVIKYYNGYPVELIVPSNPEGNNTFPYYFPITMI